MVSRQEREELLERVQQVERKHPDWSAAAVEEEVARLSPVPHGNWKDETPNLRSRLRQVQRWRKGSQGREAGRSLAQLFPYLWPLGERQRHEVDPGFAPSGRFLAGSWRLFLFNCGPEVVRDVRVRLDEMEVDYAPSILEGKSQEIHWQRVPSIKENALSELSESASRHRLEVDFVVARGTREAHLEGDLVLDRTNGWTFFGSLDGRQREVE
jgi:hypothetical protein